MKKTKLLILIMAAALLAGCSNIQNTGVSEMTDTVVQETQSAVSTSDETPTTATDEPTPEPTATVSPEDMELKYIFYIIGDGMGEAHVALGEMATRIMYEDMNAKTTWENYDYKHIITAGINSANGGTALACGVYRDGFPISVDSSSNELCTILDRAKENGLATGVITNSFITDATPATYLAHADSRNDKDDIALDVAKTDVDFLCGGGIAYLINKDMADIAGEYDSAGVLNKFVSKKFLGEYLMEGFPDIIAGESTKEDLKALEQSGDYPDKLAVIPYNIQFFCQGDTSLERYYDQIDKSVDLADVTKAGIGVLSQDEDGFVVMIEAAIVDKVSHNQAIGWIAQEMLDLDETLKVVMDFYNEHPYETLIVLTADHECAYFTYDEEKYQQFYDLPEFKFGNSGNEIYSFLEDEWNCRGDLGRLDKAYKVYEESPYIEDLDNIGPIAGEVASQTLYSLGIKSQAGQHSTLPVPLYTHGKFAEEFTDIEHIKEIAPRICEIMGWDELPAIVE